mmetsp:Transcript_106557/g.343932  ORF Transcript_106557/g.343932 Transcript_106557/m.343932 type:complete len:165 (+) Transcript_106557:186-680(+)
MRSCHWRLAIFARGLQAKWLATASQNNHAAQYFVDLHKAAQPEFVYLKNGVCPEVCVILRRLAQGRTAGFVDPSVGKFFLELNGTMSHKSCKHKKGLQSGGDRPLHLNILLESCLPCSWQRLASSSILTRRTSAKFFVGCGTLHRGIFRALQPGSCMAMANSSC